MHKLRLIGGGHQHHIRQATEIGDVERASMGRAIGAHEARAINGETHGEILQRHIMHDLVIGALQEGGIDGAEGLVALGGEARRKSHRMLLGDAHVEDAIREGVAENIHAGA